MLLHSSPRPPTGAPSALHPLNLLAQVADVPGKQHAGCPMRGLTLVLYGEVVQCMLRLLPGPWRELHLFTIDYSLNHHLCFIPHLFSSPSGSAAANAHLPPWLFHEFLLFVYLVLQEKGKGEPE